jgi:hypothetical protein
MKIISTELEYSDIKTIVFSDSKGVIRRAVFSAEQVSKGYWDVIATLHEESGKTLHTATYFQSTGNLLRSKVDACVEVTAYLNSLKNEFSGGYIWKDYQNVE